MYFINKKNIHIINNENLYYIISYTFEFLYYLIKLIINKLTKKSKNEF